MRYSCEVLVDAPRARVLELMADPDRTGEWMAGLDRTTQLQGEPGRPGSVRELRFVGMPGGPAAPPLVEKLERLDDEHYDLVHLIGPVRNEQRNTFTDATAEDGRPATRWMAEHVFHMPPGMAEQMGEQGVAAFRQNTQHSMEHLKGWLEANA